MSIPAVFFSLTDLGNVFVDTTVSREIFIYREITDILARPDGVHPSFRLFGIGLLTTPPG
jgi:hypothetical protein